MRIFFAVLIWIAISGLGFLSLPPIQQTVVDLAFVVIAVLSGPIWGTIATVSNGTFGNAYPMLILGFVICGFGIIWYQKRRTIWSYLIALFSWYFTGLLLSIGIFI